MSAVDVLAVMDRAVNCAEAYEDTQKGLHAEHARGHRKEVREARAAVAELAKRAQEAVERFEDDYDMADLRAALARVQGGQS